MSVSHVSIIFLQCQSLLLFTMNMFFCPIFFSYLYLFSCSISDFLYPTVAKWLQDFNEVK